MSRCPGAVLAAQGHGDNLGAGDQRGIEALQHHPSQLSPVAQ
jgi:hypothetical protein